MIRKNEGIKVFQETQFVGKCMVSVDFFTAEIFFLIKKGNKI